MFRRFAKLSCAAGATASGAASQASNAVPKSASDMSPREMLGVLDAHIVGQTSAKKAICVSVRNRWRRKLIPDHDLRDDITPKNILMIGPTGVGKTEIARRMAKITDAPFVKVEATKYTEVGFKGKDVETIIEDLYGAAKHKARRRLEREREDEAQKMAMHALWNWYREAGYATKSTKKTDASEPAAAESNEAAEGKKTTDDSSSAEGSETSDAAKEPSPQEVMMDMAEFEERLKAGEFDKLQITFTALVPVPQKKPSPEELRLTDFLGLGQGSAPQRNMQKFTRTIPDALTVLKIEAFEKLIDPAAVDAAARMLTEIEGIVFLDEIDKVVVGAGVQDSGDVSSLGVQQDLLPLVEGSSVNLKDGTAIKTDNILFICSGAFHSVKPSDMIAELQGRLPVRVELSALGEDDLYKILTEPKYNLVRQQVALMKAENISVHFEDGAVRELARTTAKLNATAQNIGARRLHQIVEDTMSEVSYKCDDYAGKDYKITAEDVRNRSAKRYENLELAKYLL